MSGGDANWEMCVRAHGAALERLVAAVAAVPAPRWSEPMAPGKWSPAEVGEHLALGYDAALRQLAGEGAMQMVLPAWKRVVARLLYLRPILRGDGFPARARAPRETRPIRVRGAQEEMVSALRSLGGRFDRAMHEARGADSRRRLMHPYFGNMTLDQALLMVARHLDHHRAQLVSR